MLQDLTRHGAERDGNLAKSFEEAAELFMTKDCPRLVHLLQRLM